MEVVLVVMFMEVVVLINVAVLLSWMEMVVVLKEDVVVLAVMYTEVMLMVAVLINVAVVVSWVELVVVVVVMSQRPLSLRS